MTPEEFINKTSIAPTDLGKLDTLLYLMKEYAEYKCNDKENNRIEHLSPEQLLMCMLRGKYMKIVTTNKDLIEEFDLSVPCRIVAITPTTVDVESIDMEYSITEIDHEEVQMI